MQDQPPTGVLSVWRSCTFFNYTILHHVQLLGRYRKDGNAPNTHNPVIRARLSKTQLELKTPPVKERSISKNRMTGDDAEREEAEIRTIGTTM